MTFITCEVVHEEAAGTVRRSEFDWAVYYTASHRCIGYDHRHGGLYEYGVAIVPTGTHPSCFPGFDTEEEAREAITKYQPHWPDHIRDHARALKG